MILADELHLQDHRVALSYNQEQSVCGEGMRSRGQRDMILRLLPRQPPTLFCLPVNYMDTAMSSVIYKGAGEMASQHAWGSVKKNEVNIQICEYM